MKVEVIILHIHPKLVKHFHYQLARLCSRGKPSTQGDEICSSPHIRSPIAIVAIYKTIADQVKNHL